MIKKTNNVRAENMIKLKTLYAHPLQAIGFLLLALTFLHFIGLKIEPVSFTARAYIGEFEFLTGVWCWTLASLLIISATRPSFIEKFGSLDQYYRLHKITGYCCAALTFIHIFSKEIGIAVLPALLSFEPAQPKIKGTGIASLLRPFAIDSSLIVAVIALILIAATLCLFIRYRFWLKMHRLFPLCYIILAVHVFVLMKANQWVTPLGIFTALLTIISIFYCFKSLLGFTGKSHCFNSCLTEKSLSDKYLKLTFTKSPNAPKVTAGNFIFIRKQGKNPHPYTVAAADDTTITVIIRNKGYFAEQLKKLNIKDKVLLEGPYGSFFLEPPEHQSSLWIGQGVGMTALFSAVSNLVNSKIGGSLHILILTRDADHDNLVAELKQNIDKTAAKSKITLKIHDSLNGRISQQEIDSLMRQRYSSVYFCGDAKVRDLFFKSYVRKGGIKQNFYSEHCLWR